MSTTDNTGKAKTLAIRLDPELHAQLQVIAQLKGGTITDEIRTAIESHVEHMRSAEDLAAQASAVLDDIEREAETRRGAIAALFGDSPAAPSRTRGSRKGSSSTETDASDS
jgi:predicted DNA-binding protein